MRTCSAGEGTPDFDAFNHVKWGLGSAFVWGRRSGEGGTYIASRETEGGFRRLVEGTHEKI